jgi:uncharacterized protein (TIGR02217 family)
MCSPPASERMSDFHEVLFPVDISFGSTGGPKWKTSVFQADSGFEARVSDWKSTRAEYDVSQGIKVQAQMDRLTAFFFARRGRAYGFRFKDWNDYAADNLTLGTGDYATTTFQLTKAYDSTGPDGAPHTYRRALKKIAWDSEQNVQIGGVLVETFPLATPQFYTLDPNTGIMTFSEPAAGASYTGTAATSTIDYITLAEGGHANGYFARAASGGAVAYDFGRSRAYPLATFNLGGFGGGNGLRVIDMITQVEVEQKTSNQLGTTLSPAQPFGDSSSISGIIAVNPVDGAIFVNVGNGFHWNSIAKIDATSLTIVATWGAAGNITPDPATLQINSAGCCSRDGAYFIHLPVTVTNDPNEFVAYHSTADCSRLGTVHSGVAIACCPFRESGFAVLNHLGPAATPLKLVTMAAPGLARDALVFGNPDAVGHWVLYDQRSGGILVCWQEAASDDFWCGLFDVDAGDWTWKRPMPRMIGFGSTAPEPQTPLDGVFCWVLTEPLFGTNLWFLDTANGALTTRAAPTGYGAGETFDPVLDKLLTIDASHTSIYATGVVGASFVPAPAITIEYVEFHVPVRFDTDHLSPKHEFWMTQSWDQIPLVEVRDWNDVDVD